MKCQTIKEILCIGGFLFAINMHAQVGINTTTPHAQLEIKSSDATNPANTDGILIPKVDVFPATNPTADQDGMLVYLTTDVGANLKGFYYWDNASTSWKALQSDKGWSLTGNAGTDVSTNFIGTTDNIGLKFKVNNASAGYIDPVLYNTSFGQVSANAMTTGYRNVAFGTQSLLNNLDGYYNSAVGFQSMYSNTSGHDNSAFGSSTLVLNTTGSRNSAFGMGSLNNNTTGNDNTSVGYFSMLKNIVGLSNSAFGVSSLQTNTNGSYNSAFGVGSLANNTTGYSNSAFGVSSLGSNTTGYSNSAYGLNSLSKNTIGYSNAAFGEYSLGKNISGITNSAFGAISLWDNSSGQDNSAFGFANLKNNTTGIGNCSFGAEGLRNSTTGSYNCGFGYKSLNNNITGTGNGGYGQEANPTTTTGWNNIGIGFHSLGQIDGVGNRIFGNEIGFDNIGIGLSAGDRSGNNINGCLFLGAFANVTFNNANLTNATAIGRYATVYQDNTIVLGAISGVNSATSNTRVGIGTYNPICPLQVVGSTNQFGSWAFYARSGSTTTTGFANSTSGNFSIIASDRIQATEFNAVSDARIKNILNRIDTAEALDKINQLKVTQYTYKDWLQKGTASKTGFIAQEVEKILPSAVNQTANYIPNIMQIPYAFCVDTLKNTISINLEKPISLKKGDKIRLYNRATAVESEVNIIDAYNFECTIPNQLQTDDLFVYGTEVSDFRSVDYDQLHTLSVGAIQQLSKENKALEVRIQQLETLQTSIEQRIEKLEKLEQLKTLSASK